MAFEADTKQLNINTIYLSKKYIYAYSSQGPERLVRLCDQKRDSTLSFIQAKSTWAYLRRRCPLVIFTFFTGSHKPIVVLCSELIIFIRFFWYKIRGILDRYPKGRSYRNKQRSEDLLCTGFWHWILCSRCSYSFKHANFTPKILLYFSKFGLIQVRNKTINLVADLWSEQSILTNYC